jgi:hypothetical protein
MGCSISGAIFRIRYQILCVWYVVQVLSPGKAKTQQGVGMLP